MSGFKDARQRATTLDDSISSDAKNVSDAYSELVSLSARQAMAMDYTMAKGSDGNWNKSDIMIFAKDVGVSRSVICILLFACYSDGEALQTGEPSRSTLCGTLIYAVPQ